MSCHHLRATVLSLAFVLIAAPAPAQTRDERDVPQRQAAEAALPLLRSAAVGAGAALLGLRSADEVAGATLGEPFMISAVRLDALRAWDSATDPRAVILDARRVLFPVLIGGDTRTGIEVREKQGGWKTSAIGGTRVATLLAAARAAHRSTAVPPARGYFAVHVPALNLYFLGVETATGALQLVPLVEDARYSMSKVGEPMNAAAALATLVPAARALDPTQSN